MPSRRKSNSPSISAIVPVYNEEKTVKDVVQQLLNSKLISEVICVNGGSTDNSLKVLKSFGKKVVLIDFKEREGKGQALAAGIEKAGGDIVLFMDGDLVGLTQKHIKMILEPILTKKADFVLGVPRMKGRILSKSIGIDLTGERAYYRKDLILHIEEMRNARFGVEIFMNYIFRGKKVEIVMLHNLLNPFKPWKMNLKESCRQYLIESHEVAGEVFRVKARKIRDLREKVKDKINPGKN